MNNVIHGHAYTLLTVAHAERAGKLDLVAEIVIGDQLLKRFNDLAGALHVAGRADANGDPHQIYTLLALSCSRSALAQQQDHAPRKRRGNT